MFESLVKYSEVRNLQLFMNYIGGLTFLFCFLVKALKTLFNRGDEHLGGIPRDLGSSLVKTKQEDSHSRRPCVALSQPLEAFVHYLGYAKIMLFSRNNIRVRVQTTAGTFSMPASYQ